MRKSEHPSEHDEDIVCGTIRQVYSEDQPTNSPPPKVRLVPFVHKRTTSTKKAVAGKAQFKPSNRGCRPVPVMSSRKQDSNEIRRKGEKERCWHQHMPFSRPSASIPCITMGSGSHGVLDRHIVSLTSQTEVLETNLPVGARNRIRIRIKLRKSCCHGRSFIHGRSRRGVGDDSHLL